MYREQEPLINAYRANLGAIFVGGLPGEITNQQVYDYFSKFGRISNIRLKMKIS